MHEFMDTKIDTMQRVVVLLIICQSMTAVLKKLRFGFMHFLNNRAHIAVMFSFNSSRKIKYGIRNRFYPIFARKSLTLSLDTTKGSVFPWHRLLRFIYPSELVVQEILPLPWAFEIDKSLGWEFLHEFTIFLQNYITIGLQISILLAMVARQTMVLDLGAFCCTMVPIFMISIPTNGLGGIGYSFWTNNPAYHRVAAMHQIIFDIGYRKSVLKDGAINFIIQEYERSMKELGFLSIDAEMLCYGIPIPWYWQVLEMVVEIPLIIFLFTYPIVEKGSSLSWFMTGLFVQYASSKLRQNIQKVRTAQKPLHEVLGLAEQFYKGLSFEKPLLEGARAYPDKTRSFPLARQSSLRSRSAVRDVSFDVLPGQFVLLVGQNGSGKTSLLHLISRLFDPSTGAILIDGVPIQDFDLQSLRQSMVVLLQTEEIYPISIRDNLSISLSESDKELCNSKPESFDRAAKMGGSYDFINDLKEKYETVLNPVSLFTTSSDVFGNGTVPLAVVEEMRRNAPCMAPIPLSGGEKQRLIASRAFMKLNNHSDVRLLIVDEATSALDAIAERNILGKFREHGVHKTTIFVTHQFRYLAHEADLILCMHEGRLVQKGTHSQLISDTEGEYAKLYNAQVGS
ncbi:P-loop containing nucleoside triphosphate hydrolase protein [Lentinula lateritia]|uniref:P-loop containing nucleoside triphosphate hydrolase protein n=1 Tax=Lentinula lateritia TaxID=40482 RepID=A0ABQ8VPY3_9AGAR|nr:P-loop containing nucleoside triphosphate hydrolase protein [Lentinula lateritia]